MDDDNYRDLQPGAGGGHRPSVDGHGERKSRHPQGPKLKPGIRRTQSERVKQLLISLAPFDSLYLCPITEPFPEAVQINLENHKNPVRKYEIKDYYGVTHFYAAELTPRCTYCCCSNNRHFQVYMFNLEGDLLFESIRSYSTALCLCGVDCCCCVGTIETDANYRHEGNYIGSVVAGKHCLTPAFILQNDDYDEKYLVIGPHLSHLLPCRMCYIKHFIICVPKTVTQVGKIIYGYDGLNEDLIPNPETVGVIFPPRCTSEMKALLLSAGFMLDITYFQNRGCTFHRVCRLFTHFILFFGFVGLIFFLIYKGDRLFSKK